MPRRERSRWRSRSSLSSHFHPTQIVWPRYRMRPWESDRAPLGSLRHSGLRRLMDRAFSHVSARCMGPSLLTLSADPLRTVIPCDGATASSRFYSARTRFHPPVSGTANPGPKTWDREDTSSSGGFSSHVASVMLTDPPGACHPNELSGCTRLVGDWVNQEQQSCTLADRARWIKWSQLLLTGELAWISLEIPLRSRHPRWPISSQVVSL